MDKQYQGYEPENLDTKPVLIGALALGLLVVLSMVLCAWFFGALEGLAGERDEILSPLIAERVLPPHPQLQVNPNLDVANLRNRENFLLNGYSWVDKNSGLARIPIGRAIDIVAKEGLPTAPPLQESTINEVPAPQEEGLDEATQ